MIISSETLRQANQSFNVLFSKGMANANPIYPKIAVMIPSSGSQVVYPMWDNLPGMREWLGERKINNLQPGDYTIRNKSFEYTLAVKRTDYEDDNLGIYAPIIQGMGSQAIMHRDALLYTLLSNAFSATTYPCFDSKAMCATNHSLGGRTFSNKGTAVLSETAFAAGMAKLMTAFDNNDNMLTIPERYYLCVAPSNWQTAMQITKSSLVAEVFGSNTAAAGKENVWRGMAEPIVIPLLEKSPTYWFIIAEYAGMKPIIMQIRKEPEFVAKDNPDDDNVFYKGTFEYGVDDRKNVGWGPYTLIYGSTGGA